MSTRPIRAAFESRRTAGAYYDTDAPAFSRPLSLGVAGLAVLIELGLAVAVVRPGAGILLAPFAAVVGLALVFAFPFAAACVMLALTASILYSTYFAINVGLSASAPQIILGALLVVAIVRPRRRTWGGVAGAGLAAFLAFVLLGSFLAVSAGRVSLSTNRSLTLPFAYFLFYFVAIRLFPEPARMRRLLAVCVGLGAITGFVSLLVATTGSVHSFLQAPGQGALYKQGGFLRVRLPGIALCYGLFFYALMQLMQARRKLPWAIGLTGMAAALGVSLTRNMWIGVIFGFALLIAVGGMTTRRRLLGSFVIASTAFALLILVGPQSAGPTSELKPLVDRGKTLLSPGKGLHEQSLKDRGNETAQAWKALQGHLAGGLGVGAGFGVIFDEDLGGGRFERVDQTFLHNQYLYLVVIGGVGALLAFLLYLGATLHTAWSARGRDPTMTGMFVGLVTVMISAFVMIAFVDDHFIVLLTVMGAAVFTLGRPYADA